MTIEEASSPLEGDAPLDPVERLLVECLDRAEREGPAAIEAVCAANPEHAQTIRREIATLRGLGLLAPDGDAREGAGFPRVGDFRPIRRLGEGGMGVVYLAEQVGLKRLVALKVLRGGASAGAATRFEREARTVARLRHPNVVTLYAAGEEGGTRYLAMELVPGSGLEEILKAANADGTRLPLVRVIRWGRDLARALQYAHEAGVVHRDLKPSNVRVTPDDRAMLLDFGLARDLEQGHLTRTGEFQGSPHYASPEQVAGGKEVGPATDVYSLGVTLYECAAGRVPFAGTTTEQLFHQILAREPAPPRGANSAIPRDLETVILKAIEKDPARRYASAGALADDLDALLEFRPVAARRPRLAARAAKWARRNPGGAAAAATAFVAALGFVALLAVNARADRRLAREAVADARARLEAYRKSREEARALDAAVADLQENVYYRYLTPDEDRLLDEKEAEADLSRRRRETAVVEILAILQRAERLDSTRRGAREVRSLLYLEKMREAEAAKAYALGDFYRNLAFETDPETASASEYFGTGGIEIASDPPGAEAFLFRYRDQSEIVRDGEPRLVPVPVGGDAPVVPGTWCLRVTQGAGEIEKEDLLLEVAGRPIRGTMLVAEGAGEIARLDRLVSIDGEAVVDEWEVDLARAPTASAPAERAFEFEREGARTTVRAPSFAALGIEVATPAALAERGGVPARRFRAGEVREVSLPPGLRVRATATPLFPSPACSLGPTPARAEALEPGSYLVLLRAPGREDLRRPVRVWRTNTRRVEARLPLTGEGPAGFVFVPPLPDAPIGGGDFWIMEREVTCAEYRAFLEDPEVAPLVGAAAAPLVPREGEGPHWKRGEDGRFSLPADWTLDWPVLGISWFDAMAYARWKTERSKRAGEPWVFSLPRFREWQTAGYGADSRMFVFGTRFRPKWMKSNYARRHPGPEPVLRFPIDESPFGAFDMSGSLLEWIDDWYIEREGLRRVSGGGWGQGEGRAYFNVEGGHGVVPEGVWNMVGFRLVARRDPR